MVKAVYPGSFDPLTYGHLDIIMRANDIFSEINVAVLENPDKECLFTFKERVKFIAETLEENPQIKVDSFSGLTINYVRNIGASVVVRGLRSISDFEGEFQMANMNKQMDEKVETVFLMTSPEYIHVSSSLVKEIAKFQGDFSQFVPESSARALNEKFSF